MAANFIAKNGGGSLGRGTRWAFLGDSWFWVIHDLDEAGSYSPGWGPEIGGLLLQTKGFPPVTQLDASEPHKMWFCYRYMLVILS